MTVMFITWDANTPVAAKTYVLTTNWPSRRGWINGISPDNQGTIILVNDKPWHPGMTLTCGDVVAYQVTKPFPNPAIVEVDLIMGAEPCPEEADGQTADEDIALPPPMLPAH